MTYCTQQDLTDRFGEDELISLTDHNDTGTVDTAVLNLAINDATAEINAYISVYLPLSSTPAVLTIHACNIARYRLYDERSLDEVTERYNQAISFLKRVADGKATLGLPPAQSQQVSHRVTAKKGVSATDWGTY